MVIIGVSDEASNVIEKYLKENKVTWLIANDPPGKTMREYGANAYPTLFLIDPNGKVAWTGHGGLTDAQLKEVLKDAKGTDSTTGSGDKPSTDGKKTDGDKKDE